MRQLKSNDHDFFFATTQVFRQTEVLLVFARSDFLAYQLNLKPSCTLTFIKLKVSIPNSRFFPSEKSRLRSWNTASEPETKPCGTPKTSLGLIFTSRPDGSFSYYDSVSVGRVGGSRLFETQTRIRVSSTVERIPIRQRLYKERGGWRSRPVSRR